jgi:phage shock protein C
MNENQSTLPPPPQSRALRRIRRSDDDRMIAGVAGGIAEHFDVDPGSVRLAFAALAVFGGSGLLFYLIAWIVIPAEDEPAYAESTVGQTATDEPEPVPFTVMPMV